MPHAQLARGLFASFSHYYPRDDEKAVLYLTKAAKQGMPMAQFYLALMYQRGRGVEQSNEQALHWNMLAAEQGYPDAEYAMSRMAELGIGVTADKAWSMMWLDRAAHHGDAAGAIFDGHGLSGRKIGPAGLACCGGMVLQGGDAGKCRCPVATRLYVCQGNRVPCGQAEGGCLA